MGGNDVSNVSNSTSNIQIGTVVPKRDAKAAAEILFDKYHSGGDTSDTTGLTVESSSTPTPPPESTPTTPTDTPKNKGNIEGFVKFMNSKGINIPAGMKASEVGINEEDLNTLRDLYIKELNTPKKEDTPQSKATPKPKLTTAQAMAEKAKRSDPNQIGTYKNDQGTFFAKTKLNASGVPESFTAYKVNEKGEAIDTSFTGTYGQNGEVIIDGQNKTQSLLNLPKTYFQGIAMAAKEHSAGANIPENEQNGYVYLRVDKNQLNGFNEQGEISTATDGIQRGTNYGQIKTDAVKKPNFFEGIPKS